MKNGSRIGFIFIVSVTTLGLWFAEASAQPPGPPPATRPPTVSPYLNLLRRGTTPGVNYYGLVRPQQEFRGAVQGLQQQLESKERTQELDRATGLPTTGHAAVFLDTKGYFLNVSPGLGRPAPSISVTPNAAGSVRRR